jgi:queuine/archaeosine tRNA-ribosyltransferase
MIMANPLEQEFNYYLQHQDKLVEMYGGKYIVIKNQKVVGSYNSEIQAIRESVKDHQLGTFLVQKCEAGSASYTQTYHSRVVFA